MCSHSECFSEHNSPEASCVHVFIPKTAAAFDYATKKESPPLPLAALLSSSL